MQEKIRYLDNYWPHLFYNLVWPGCGSIFAVLISCSPALQSRLAISSTVCCYVPTKAVPGSRPTLAPIGRDKPEAGNSRAGEQLRNDTPSISIK